MQCQIILLISLNAFYLEEYGNFTYVLSCLDVQLGRIHYPKEK